MDNISKERIDFLRESKNFVKPVLQMLQDNGGELSGFSQIDKLISQYTDVSDTDMNYSKISDKGNKYIPYHFGRNFAVKNLEIAGCLDKQSLKTTRVAIQCKRFIDNPVGSPDIISLRGTLPTHQAEYGIMITTSYFTNDAIKVSREGNMPITLIDGTELVNLMVEHKYKVRETLTYTPNEEYFNA